MHLITKNIKLKLVFLTLFLSISFLIDTLINTQIDTHTKQTNFILLSFTKEERKLLQTKTNNLEMQTKKNFLIVEFSLFLLTSSLFYLLYISLIRKKELEALVKDNRLKDSMMQQQSRFAQMGEMISMIAHQWRQPLSAISTTVTDLEFKLELDTYNLEEARDREKCKAYFLERFSNISIYTNTLTTTIDDFRNFYRPDKARVTTDFKSIIEKSIQIIGESLRNDNIELQYIYNSQLSLEMYDNEMMQVVLNIFQNSQDTFKEKKIENPKIIIDVTDTTLEISDNGGGIPNNILKKIFDPYFSTKKVKNGTGLGLYMSKTIVEEHHTGKLIATNTKDGVCFRIDLTNKLKGE